jgi:homoserine/homoserine lactone efflux protein
MIDPALYLAFVLATSVLMLIPGPNVALIVANSVAHGVRYGLLTLAGTASAMVPQLLLTALGMSALLGRFGDWMGWLRWVGVLYLLWLGVRQWRAPAPDLGRVAPQPREARRMYLRGLLVSLTNPKTLFFYGAFFPQFVAPGRPAAPQLVVLCATFLAVALILDSLWAVLAGRLRHLLAARGRWRNRLTGGILIGAGLGLAVAHRR